MKNKLKPIKINRKINKDNINKKLIVFAFSDNLSAENSKLYVGSGTHGTQHLECMRSRLHPEMLRNDVQLNVWKCASCEWGNYRVYGWLDLAKETQGGRKDKKSPRWYSKYVKSKFMKFNYKHLELASKIYRKASQW